MKINRLLAIGLSMALLLVSVPVYVSASSDEDKANIGRLVVGDYENPVSLESIESMRAVVDSEAESFVEEKDSSTPKLGLSLPEDYTGQIVAYAYLVNKDGIPMQFVGIAGDESSVDSVIEEANEWYESTIIDDIICEYDAKGLEWDLVGYNADYTDSAPYGVVQNSYWIYYLNDDEDSTYDWFYMKQFAAVEPGCHAFGSSWVNYESNPSQDWGWGEMEYSLANWGPTGIINGSTTVGVQLTGGSQATLGAYWEFTHPEITTYDDTSIAQKKASWVSSFYDTSLYSTCGIYPGSCCKTYQPMSSGTYDLVKVESLGSFLYGFNVVGIGLSWGLPIVYS